MRCGWFIAPMAMLCASQLAALELISTARDDFYSTLLNAAVWNGVVEVRDFQGNPVATSVTSLSGTDYAGPVELPPPPIFDDGFEALPCPNGVVEGSEQCDDGNLVETDGCTSLCHTAAVCNTTMHDSGDRFAVDLSNGHCFVSFDSEMTSFADAQGVCQSADGNLATVSGAEENAVVLSVQNPAENPWVGASDSEVEGTFAWVTAEPFTFTAFAPGEPNDGNGSEDCLHITNAEGQWADTNCDFVGFVSGRICELEP